MGKNSYLFPVLTIIFILYLFLFPYPVKEEFLLIPEKKISLNDSLAGSEAGRSGNWAFRSFNKMGYYDGETGAYRLFDGGGRTGISDRFYMEEEGDSLSLVSRSGDMSVPIETTLIPVFFDDHFFLTDYFQGYIREIDTRGRILWEYSLPSMITGLDNRNGMTAVGLLNGDVFLFDPAGNPVYSWNPGGSRISVIYGIALSLEGDKIALVSGLDPQRFILIEKKENGYRPVFHENLSQSFRTPLSLTFDAESNIIIEGEGKGLYYSPGKPSLDGFELPGDFHDSGAFPRDGTILFQSQDNRGSVLSLFTERGEKIFENHYSDEPFSLEVREGKILLSGRENVYILRREFH